MRLLKNLFNRTFAIGVIAKQSMKGLLRNDTRLPNAKLLFRKTDAFSLMELLIVFITIGIIAGFAIPNYTESLKRAHIRNAIVQLTSLQAANAVFNARQGTYLTGDKDLTGINDPTTGLGINLIAIDTKTTFSYAGGAGASYDARMTWSGAGAPVIVKMTDKTVDMDKNPCCVTNNCTPLLKNCP